MRVWFGILYYIVGVDSIYCFVILIKVVRKSCVFNFVIYVCEFLVLVFVYWFNNIYVYLDIVLGGENISLNKVNANYINYLILIVVNVVK